jgi:CheY-like chemotaxis protein
MISDAHSGTIDLLLTDVVMPHTSGPRLAEQLAAKRPELKVLFISGYTEEAIQQHGVLRAGTAFVQKPFTPQALASVLRDVLDTQLAN